MCLSNTLSTAELFWNLWNPLHSTAVHVVEILSTITITVQVAVYVAVVCIQPGEATLMTFHSSALASMFRHRTLFQIVFSMCDLPGPDPPASQVFP